MNKLKKFESKKLHYGKYLYKLVLANSLAPWFRTEFQKDGSLKFLKSKLDEYQLMYDMGQPLYRTVYRTEIKISDEEFLDATDIYNILLQKDDYKIRVERWSSFCIYSNDKDLLTSIVNQMRVSVREFWEPDIDIIDTLLDNKNFIITDTEVEFPIKITFNYKKIDANFANWIKNNQNKCSIGERALYNISRGYASGNYIFVRDEKILMMVKMIVGHNIQRIERLVSKTNIDKY